MSQIDVTIMLHETTLHSEEINRAELTKDYGFAAEQFNADIPFEIVKDRLPMLLQRTDEPVEIAARFSIPGESLRFRGLLDPTELIRDGREGERGGVVNISARSILARVLDDEENQPLTKSYTDTTWSEIVRDIVTRLGFSGAGSSLPLTASPSKQYEANYRGMGHS